MFVCAFAAGLLLGRAAWATPPPCATMLAQVAGAKGAITTVAFSPDGTLVAFGTRNGALHMWRSGADSARVVPGGGRWVSFGQRKPKAPWRLFALGQKGTLDIYDAQTGKRDDWIDGCGALAALSVAPVMLVTAQAELSDAIRLYPLAAEIPADHAVTLPRVVGFVGRLTGLVTNLDASALALAGTIPGGGPGIPSDGFVVFVNRQGGAPPKVHKLDSAVLSLAATSDRTLMVSVGYEGDADMQTGRIHLWDMATGRLHLTLPPQPRAVASAAFRPSEAAQSGHSEALLATGGLDGALRFWDAPSGRMRGMLKVDGAITALAFDGSGDRLAVGTDDGTVRIYAVAIARPGGSVDVAPGR